MCNSWSILILDSLSHSLLIQVKSTLAVTLSNIEGSLSIVTPVFPVFLPLARTLATHYLTLKIL